MTTGPEQLPPAKFDPKAAHMNRPKLRQVRAFPVNVQNQQAMGLSDAKQISDKMIAVPMAFQVVLPLLDGTRTVDEIVTQVGRGLTRPILEGLVAQLDDAGLLFGPTFDGMLAKMRAAFDASPNLPPASTAQFTDAVAAQVLGEGFEQASAQERDKAAVEKSREIMDQWIAQALENADNPSFDDLPKAIVAPHLDYPRGWLNYASAYGRMRVVDPPDRIVILGTNHFGEGTGVVGCDKGYQTAFGTCEVDQELVGKLRKKLGDGLFASRYDHEREHSIELHIPWIQHVFGGRGGAAPKVFGALVHDPVVNNGESYDGKGVALEPFVNALRESLAELGGRTLVVASADLSHAGPAFGDQQPLAGETPEVEQARNRVIQTDREFMDLVRDNKPDELVAAMAWQQNPTRWCSVGNLVAVLKTVQPSEVEILNYSGAMDQQGITFVTSAAMVMR